MTLKKIEISDGFESADVPAVDSLGVRRDLSNLEAPTAINEDLIFQEGKIGTLTTAPGPMLQDSKDLNLKTGDAPLSYYGGDINIIPGSDGTDEYQGDANIQGKNVDILGKVSSTLRTMFGSFVSDMNGASVLTPDNPSGDTKDINLVTGTASGIKGAIYLLGRAVSVGSNLVMNMFRITNLADPIDPQDAATKFYADSKDVAIADEGTVLTPAVDSINFVGAGVTVTGTAGNLTVTIPGGGGGGGAAGTFTSVYRQISAAEIAQGYFDIIGIGATYDQFQLFFYGLLQTVTVDYSLSVVSGNLRVTFISTPMGALGNIIVANDYLTLNYRA